MWENRLKHVRQIENISFLPQYAFQFFFMNLKGFCSIFLLVTFCSVTSAVLRFTLVYLMSHILSNLDSLQADWVLQVYIPIWFCAALAAELLDFILRKYGEALSVVYGDYTELRFYLTFLTQRSHRVLNVSKERILQLTSKYVSHVRQFLDDWIWGITFRSTRLVIIIVILAFQDPLVLALNTVYILFLLSLALRISLRFSQIARSYSLQTLETGTIMTSFILNLNTLRRLALRPFFENVAADLTKKNWLELERLRTFHARRWFLQLNLFNLLYIGTLAYGVYQVKTGRLPLGFLILITWAFTELWHIIVYAIEYFVALVQQREDALLVRKNFAEFVGDSPQDKLPVSSDGENLTIELSNLSVGFEAARGENSFALRVSNFSLSRGDKIGVIGPSGSGKTTLFNVLLNLVSYQGIYRINGVSTADYEIPSSIMSVISSNDPLFKLSLRDNILLGKDVPPDKLASVLKGVNVSDFAPELSARIGDPEVSLSAGEEQRLRLARGLLVESEVYLLDEPFNGLDRHTKEKVIRFMREYLKDKAILLVTHNKEELSLIEKIYEIKDGELLLANNISRTSG